MNRPIAIVACRYGVGSVPDTAAWEGVLGQMVAPRPARLYAASILGRMSEREPMLAGEVPWVAQPDPLARAAERVLGPDVPVTWINSTCTSGAGALGLAALAVAQGAPAALAAAYEEQTRFNQAGFAALRSLAADHPRPFARARDGFRLRPGWGAAWLAPGAADGIRIAGFATTNDAHHPTGPHREGTGLKRCLEDCLAMARIEPPQVACLKLSGSGTPYSDAAEYKALAAVFGDRLPAIPAYVLKSGIGHLQGASGLVESLVAWRYLQSGIVPSVGREIMADLEFPLGFSGAARRLYPRNVLLVFSGFGGQNACLILEKSGAADRSRIREPAKP